MDSEDGTKRSVISRKCLSQLLKHRQVSPISVEDRSKKLKQRKISQHCDSLQDKMVEIPICSLEIPTSTSRQPKYENNWLVHTSRYIVYLRTNPRRIWWNIIVFPASAGILYNILFVLKTHYSSSRDLMRVCSHSCIVLNEVKSSLRHTSRGHLA